MNCREMMQIPELNSVLCLKAGSSGLEKEVRWIYFADCLQCVQREYQMEDYIHGGEFVILTNRKVTDDSAKLKNLIEQMQSRQITALGINEGQISDLLIDYCEEHQLPLFELPEEYPLIDLSQSVCKRLVLEENSRNSAEQLFSSILDAKHLNRERVLAQAGYLNVNLEGSFCVAEFAFGEADRRKGEGKTSGKKDAQARLELGQKIRRILRSEFRLYTEEELLILPQTGSILVLVPTRERQEGRQESRQESRLKETAYRIIERIQKEYQETVTVGIGGSKEYLTEIRESRNEAATAVRAAAVKMQGRGKQTGGNVVFFQELGMYMLISQVENQKALDDYVELHLGKLMQAEEIHKGNLCETLEHYLNCNCNAKKTAEEMFVHRNTLNYRLKKISEILNCDFEELEECLELKLAFEILRYKGC